MARLKEKRRNERGSALLEALAVSSLLVVLVSGVLFCAYLLFARAWIEFQVEQSLYCLAENQNFCRRRLETRVRRFLSFGSFQVGRLGGSEGRYQAEALWKFQQIRFSFKKELALNRAARNRDLRW